MRKPCFADVIGAFCFWVTSNFESNVILLMILLKIPTDVASVLETIYNIMQISVDPKH